MKASLCVLVSTLLGAAGATCGQIVNYDFEAPSYVPGPLNGQQGWGLGGGTCDVASGFARHGTQAMRFQTSVPGSGVSSHFTGFNSNQYWSASFSLFINSAGTDPNTFTAINLGTSLGVSWYFGVFGDGRVEDFGSPILHDTLGSGALNQWLDITAIGFNPTGVIDVHVVGAGIDRFFHTTLGVQGVRQDLVTIDMNHQVWSGAYPSSVFVDDVQVTATPAPGGLVVLIAGGLLAGRRRR